MSGPDDRAVIGRAEAVLRAAEAAGLKLATAESCTGGLLAAVLTEIEGLSHVFDRGFVAYTDAAKQQLLGVRRETLERCGAVSAPCAEELAAGALERAEADVAVSVTGFAGGGAPGEAAEGLVYAGVAIRGRRPRAAELHLPAATRAAPAWPRCASPSTCWRTASP